MDVNVEYIGPKKAKTAEVFGITSFALAFLFIFLNFPSSNLWVLGFAVSTLVGIVWWGAIPFPILGRITFSENGLNINHSDEEEFLSIDNLTNSEILIMDYYGKLDFSLIDDDGRGNFLRIGKRELRFKLGSKSHRNCLFDVIELWRLQNPEIILSTNFF